jgi:hypothetical protein
MLEKKTNYFQNSDVEYNHLPGIYQQAKQNKIITPELKYMQTFKKFLRHNII